MTGEIKKSISISHHALQRLEERVGTYGNHRSWQQYVKKARYEGKSRANMTPEEKKWISKHIHKIYRANQVRLFDGFAFIFKGNRGHARTLVTVITITQ